MTSVKESLWLQIFMGAIQNFEKLAVTPLRKQALLIAEAAFAALSTRRTVARKVTYHAGRQSLKVGGQSFDLSKFRRVFCVGFGKAALAAVKELREILGSRINAGYVLDVASEDLGQIVSRAGTHPLPSQINLEATAELVKLLSGLNYDDLVVCAVSGGGSSLLCYPSDMSYETESLIVRELNKQGASIFELNTVRKHLSRVKGGNLAKLLYPATCISLIFSDVPGDDLSQVASGPTVMDATTAEDAKTVLKKYQILELCRLPACKLAETPKEKKYFAQVHNLLLVSGTDAVKAAQEAAEDLGFKTRIASLQYQGLARNLGQKFAAATLAGECLLGCGESTVKVKGQGMGGRNQEMALGALGAIAPGQVFVALASDGRDNTDAAGALADALVAQTAKALAFLPEQFLDNNDAYHFFESAGGLIFTGLTGSNVSDFFVSLRS